MASTITAGNATNGLAIASDNTGALEIKTGSGAGTTAITISSAQAATFAGAVTAAAGFVGNASTATKLTTASGSAPSYSARAWVNFNGSGVVAIRASGNVSSITDNSTGNYTINFATAMPDANFSIQGFAAATSQSGNIAITGPNPVYATGSINIVVRSGAGVLDAEWVNLSVFR